MSSRKYVNTYLNSSIDRCIQIDLTLTLIAIHSFKRHYHINLITHSSNRSIFFYYSNFYLSLSSIIFENSMIKTIVSKVKIRQFFDYQVISNNEKIYMIQIQIYKLIVFLDLRAYNIICERERELLLVTIFLPNLFYRISSCINISLFF